MNLLTEQYVKFITFVSCLKANLKDQKGQTLVEYALLLALIAIVVIGVVIILGQKTCKVYSFIGSSLTQ